MDIKKAADEPGDRFGRLIRGNVIALFFETPAFSKFSCDIRDTELPRKYRC